MKADWVYRPNLQPIYNPAGAAIANGDALGTYDQNEFTVGTGSAAGRVLYDSHDHIRHFTNAGGAPGQPIIAGMPASARAEGSQATILAVQGVIWLRKSEWALGNVMRTGWRIGVFEQQPESGAISIDANYSLFNTFATAQPALWANDRMWVQQRLLMEMFGGASDQGRTYYVNWKGRRRLKPFQCMGMYIETHSTSVNAIYTLWLRTLVADEG